LEEYDVVMVGGGPAGLTAGLYTSRAKLKSVLIEKKWPGGQILNTELIEDYPGFESIKGPELAQRMEEQVRKLGLQIEMDTVTKVRSRGGRKVVETEGGQEYLAKAVIVTTGGEPRKLDIPGREALEGRGVSYCAICDAAFFKDQVVAVVGGGDAAVEEAIFLTRFASKVYLMHRRDAFRAQAALVEKARGNEKIEILLSTVVKEIHGRDQVEYLTIDRKGEIQRLDATGLFFFIGFTPNSDMFDEPIELDPQGHIVTDYRMESSIPGIFIAGDVRAQLTRQITTAVGDGTTAAIAAQHYVEAIEDAERAAATVVEAPTATTAP
jgi:thioredoxin reductase (NADPH)